jgi:GR25 family glycosyltransferase involved in LPS biosynthesis
LQITVDSARDTIEKKMELAFAIVADRSSSRPLLLEYQKPAQELIRRFSGRAARAWDAMQRLGIACDLHLSPFGPVLCLDSAARLERIGGACAWSLTECSVVSAAGRADFDGGDAGWWRRPGAFGDSEEAFVSAVEDPSKCYSSAEDALCGRQAEGCGERPTALFHKVWLYEYVPRWLESEGVVVWRAQDVARLPRTRARWGAFRSPQELGAFAALEILYEFGGRVLEPHQSPGGEAAPAAPALSPALSPALLWRMRSASLVPFRPPAVPSSAVGMVVYVNLDRCPAKRDAMDRRLFVDGSFETLDIRRFRAVDGSLQNAARMVHEGRLALAKYMEMVDRSGTVSDKMYPFTEGALGCAESHIRILREVVRKNVTALVFEDDVVIDSSFEAALTPCMQSRGDFWDLLFCRCQPLQMQVKRGHHTITWRKADGTYAFVVTPRGASILLESAYPIRCPIDHHIEMLNKSRLLRVHSMVKNHVSTVSVFQDPTVSSIARTKVAPITIPRTMHVRFEHPDEMNAWARAHPHWDVRAANGEGEHTMADGGVFIDARAVRAPSRPIDYLLHGVRGFSCAADGAATALSASAYGFEKDHPLFAGGKAATFATLRDAWGQDEEKFLLHMKLLHRAVF